MRKVVAAVLFALAGACLLLSGLLPSNLFDDYKDSPDSTFRRDGRYPVHDCGFLSGGGVFALPDSARSSLR